MLYGTNSMSGSPTAHIDAWLGLLPESGGFEGLVMIEVAPNPDRLAVLEVSDVGERRLGWDPACLTARAEMA